MHFVLVGLNCDTSQSGIADDTVGFSQVTVTGGETILEQLQQVDLTAGAGQHVEVFVVDVNVTVDVSSSDVSSL